MGNARTYIIALAILALVLIGSKVSATKLIAEFEGFEEKAYQDSAGVWTIGYGSTRNPITGLPVKKGDTITNAKALEWLKMQTSASQGDVNRLVKVPINENQRTALTSFVYNIGPTRFAKSTMLRKLNAGAPKQEVAAEFMRWIYAGGKVIPGLKIRRELEKQLFLS
jgi:lysozyme